MCSQDSPKANCHVVTEEFEKLREPFFIKKNSRKLLMWVGYFHILPHSPPKPFAKSGVLPPTGLFPTPALPVSEEVVTIKGAVSRARTVASGLLYFFFISVEFT